MLQSSGPNALGAPQLLNDRSGESRMTLAGRLAPDARGASEGMRDVFIVPAEKRSERPDVL